MGSWSSHTIGPEHHVIAEDDKSLV